MDGREAAALGPHVHDGQVGIVVDEQRGFDQASDTGMTPFGLALRRISTKAPRLDPRLLGIGPGRRGATPQDRGPDIEPTG